MASEHQFEEEDQYGQQQQESEIGFHGQNNQMITTDYNKHLQGSHGLYLDAQELASFIDIPDDQLFAYETTPSKKWIDRFGGNMALRPD